MTDGRTRDNDSYQGRFDYAGDRYGAAGRVPEGRRQLQPRGRLRAARQLRAHLRVRRGSARGRDRGSRRVRQFTYQASVEYIENGVGDARDAQPDRPLHRRAPEQRPFDGRGERPTTSCCCARSRRRPASAFRRAATTSTTSPSLPARAAAPRHGTVSLQTGEFYDGTITGVRLHGARVRDPEAVVGRAERARSTT